MEVIFFQILFNQTNNAEIILGVHKTQKMLTQLLQFQLMSLANFDFNFVEF